MNKGFTLIELLVVVLIIGILASVALPQYQKAVTKAHLANLKSLVRGIQPAIDSYYLADGSFPESFDALDLNIPQPKSIGNVIGLTAYVYDWGYCMINTDKELVGCYDTKRKIGFNYMRKLGTYACLADMPETSYTHKICKQDSGAAHYWYGISIPGRDFGGNNNYYQYFYDSTI